MVSIIILTKVIVSRSDSFTKPKNSSLKNKKEASLKNKKVNKSSN
jgi:hypothetical protein